MDFLGFAALCGPAVHPVTTAAIVKVESGYDALAIRDSTLRVTFRPSDLATARVIVEEEAKAGHRLAIGLMQVTLPWVAMLRMSPAELLDPCTNIRIGTSILAADYRACAVPSRTSKVALECALSAYWAGDGAIGGAYVNQVYRLAGSAQRMTVTAGVTDGILGSSRSE